MRWGRGTVVRVTRYSVQVRKMGRLGPGERMLGGRGGSTKHIGSVFCSSRSASRAIISGEFCEGLLKQRGSRAARRKRTVEQIAAAAAAVVPLKKIRPEIKDIRAIEKFMTMMT